LELTELLSLTRAIPAGSPYKALNNNVGYYNGPQLTKISSNAQ
jgi:hypothetical protein